MLFEHLGVVRHTKADALLAALEPGCAVAEAIDAALQSGADPATLSEAIGPWLRLFVERGFIEAR